MWYSGPAICLSFLGCALELGVAAATGQWGDPQGLPQGFASGLGSGYPACAAGGSTEESWKRDRIPSLR